MAVVFASLRQWDAATLLIAAGELDEERTRLWRAAVQLLAARSALAVAGAWSGPAAETAFYRSAQLLQRLARASAGLAAATAALQTAASRVAAVRRAVGEADSVAGARGWTLGRDGLPQSTYRPCTSDPVADVLQQRADERALAQLRQIVTASLMAAHRIDTELTKLLRDGAYGRITPATAGPTALPLPPPLGPLAAALPDRRPYASAAWWRLLTTDEQARVIHEHPEWIAMRDGIPGWAREKANLTLLARYERELAPDDPRRAELATLANVLAAHPDAHLLGVDLNGRAGSAVRAIISFGDIDQDAYVTTFVGGATTSVDDLPLYAGWLANVRREARIALRESNKGGDVAAVMWMGYDAPQWLDRPPDAGPSSWTPALNGAGDLADFSIGVEAARDTPVYQTHLAHSYGTLVDALALKHVNMPVRALGWAGSPSTPARSALELGVKPGALNVFRGQTDPVPFIGLLQWFGPDPAEIAGARDLRTEPRTWADGRRTAGSEGHSQYFAADTTAVRSVGRILVGVDRDQDVEIRHVQPAGAMGQLCVPARPQ